MHNEISKTLVLCLFYVRVLLLTLCALLRLYSHNRLSRRQFYLLSFGCWLWRHTLHHCSRQKLLLWGKASATIQKKTSGQEQSCEQLHTGSGPSSSSFIRMLTVSSQKRSKSSFLCCLLRVMSQRPPLLFLSSSHIGSTPSWNTIKKNWDVLTKTEYYTMHHIQMQIVGVKSIKATSWLKNQLAFTPHR